MPVRLPPRPESSVTLFPLISDRGPAILLLFLAPSVETRLSRPQNPPPRAQLADGSSDGLVTPIIPQLNVPARRESPRKDQHLPTY